jgi:hypothetical protein
MVRRAGTDWTAVLERIARETERSVTATYNPSGSPTARWILRAGRLGSGAGATLEEALANLEADLRRLGHLSESPGSPGGPPERTPLSTARPPPEEQTRLPGNAA